MQNIKTNTISIFIHILLIMQIMQTKIYPKLWVFLWFFKSSLNLKPKKQMSQTNGLSSVCHRILWRSRTHLLAKALLQTSQANGLCPVCVLSWVVRLDFRANFLSQYEQAWGFSPVWLFKWSLKLCNFVVE